LANKTNQKHVFYKIIKFYYIYDLVCFRPAHFCGTSWFFSAYLAFCKCPASRWLFASVENLHCCNLWNCSCIF